MSNRWFGRVFLKRDAAKVDVRALLEQLEDALEECSNRQLELRHGIVEYERMIEDMKIELRQNAEAAERFQALKAAYQNREWADD